MAVNPNGPILVTGGGGFLGRHIVRKLLAAGKRVRVAGRSRYPDLLASGVECVQGNLSDPEFCRAAVQGCPAVVHTAAQPGIWGSYQDYHQNNFLATKALLEAARAEGGQRFLYTSTPSVVFGKSPIEGGDEDLPYPDAYLTHYAATKAEAERLVLAAAGSGKDGAFATAALRPHLIFGPGDNHLIPKLLARARAGRLRVIGSGKNLISVSYVENVADAHVQLLERLLPTSVVNGRAYFVNEPDPVNCWDFINRLVTAFSLPPVTKRVPYGLAYGVGCAAEFMGKLSGRKEDPVLTRFLVTQLGMSHWFRPERARQDFGWRPEVGMEEAIRRLVESYRDDGDKRW